jgi:hypothetical protein
MGHSAAQQFGHVGPDGTGGVVVWLPTELRRLKTVGHVLIAPVAVRVFQGFKGVNVERPQVDYVVALAAYSDQIIDMLMTKIVVGSVVDL